MCRTAPRHNIVDLSVKDGRPYLQKAPGLSWLAVAPYAGLHWLTGAHVPYHSAAALLALLCVLLPIIGCALVLWRRLGSTLGPRAWLGSLLALLLASPMAVYSGTFQDYPLAAMLLFTGWAVAMGGRKRDHVLGGLLVGAAAATNYAFFIYGGILALVECLRRRESDTKPLTWLGFSSLGAAIPTAAIAIYHTVMWGSPATTAYAFMADSGQIALHAGIQFEWSTLVRLLIGGKHGLLVHTPWSLPALVGLVLLARDRERRWLGVAGIVMIVTNLGFASVWNTTNDDTLAFARHTVPSLPWLALGLAGLLGWLYERRDLAGALMRGAVGGGIAVGAIYQLAVMWTFPYHAERLAAPIWQVNLPLLAEGLHLMPIWTSLSHSLDAPGNGPEWWTIGAMALATGALLVTTLASVRWTRKHRLAALAASIVVMFALLSWGASSNPVTEADRAWAKALSRTDVGALAGPDRERLKQVIRDRRAYRASSLDVAESRKMKADLMWRDTPWPAKDGFPPWCATETATK
ncbi:MAG: hypothetical protein ACI9OJ_003217 [Myxococcota bacterium]|jgi:hypothetical protein